MPTGEELGGHGEGRFSRSSFTAGGPTHRVGWAGFSDRGEECKRRIPTRKESASWPAWQIMEPVEYADTSARAELGNTMEPQSKRQGERERKGQGKGQQGERRSPSDRSDASSVTVSSESLGGEDVMILSSPDEDSAKLSAPLPCVGTIPPCSDLYSASAELLAMRDKIFPPRQAGEVATGRGETCFPLPVPTSCEAWAELAVHAACGTFHSLTHRSALQCKRGCWVETWKGVPLPNEAPKLFWSQRHVNSYGEEVHVAKQVRWANVSSSLPAKGLAGVVSASDVCVGGVKHYIDNPPGVFEATVSKGVLKSGSQRPIGPRWQRGCLTGGSVH